MNASEYTVRTMSRGEIDFALDCAAAEGWNPGLYDADCFYAADTGGFLVGECNREPVASISVVKYGSTFGFLGFYIVRPEHRGQGFGFRIWEAGLKRLSGRNIGLDGVVAQQENYKKSGFKTAYRNIRFEGTSGGDSPANPAVVDLSVLPFDMVAAYDRPFFPDDRSAFLKSWLRQPESTALGFMQNGTLSGYGMIRVCRAGYKIGPLFADAPDRAEALFLSLKAGVTPGRPLYLDAPETNPAAVALAERHGLNVVFETARMYTGALPELPLNRLFGVTSFELG
jgi:GNAT superfamily N-acetyltransferase